jgi:hypothetical protein
MANQDEKTEEKQEEKRSDQAEKDEKYVEKGLGWQRDSLSSIIWALALIWAGIVLLLRTWDISLVAWMDWENVVGAILVGIALLIGLEIAIRLLVPRYAARLKGRVILAVILGFLGLSNLTKLELWPLVLIGVGVAILIANLGRRR